MESIEHERKQNWAGACITSSLESHIEEINLYEHLFPLLLEYEIPFKDDLKKARYAVNWQADPVNFIKSSIIKDKFPPYEESSDVEKKIQNTKKFVRYINNQHKESGFFEQPSNRKVVRDSETRAVRVMLEEEND